MMCAATVCPVSPLNFFTTFDREDNLLSKETVSQHSETTWRSTNSASRWATFMLNHSPISNRFGIQTLDRTVRFRTTHDLPEKFDIISELPIEISLTVFGLLNEEDLCNICLVSREWFSIAQDMSLKLRRKAYIKSQRTHYQQLKENYHGPFYTPPQPHSSVISSSTYFSPLHSLNNKCLEDYSSGMHCDIHTTTPSYENSTPMANVVDSVERLNIHASDVRRCLFPCLKSAGVKQPSCKNKLGGIPLCQSEGQPAATTQYHMVIRKSKARLRRL